MLPMNLLEDVPTCTEGRALVFLSQTCEVCSHSCRTHTVLQIYRLPLQPLPQQQLFSLKSRYTPPSMPHRNTVNRHLGMNGPTMTQKVMESIFYFSEGLQHFINCPTVSKLS